MTTPIAPALALAPAPGRVASHPSSRVTVHVEYTASKRKTLKNYEMADLGKFVYSQLDQLDRSTPRPNWKNLYWESDTGHLCYYWVEPDTNITSRIRGAVDWTHGESGRRKLEKLGILGFSAIFAEEGEPAPDASSSAAPGQVQTPGAVSVVAGSRGHQEGMPAMGVPQKQPRTRSSAKQGTRRANLAARGPAVPRAPSPVSGAPPAASSYVLGHVRNLPSFGHYAYPTGLPQPSVPVPPVERPAEFVSLAVPIHPSLGLSVGPVAHDAPIPIGGHPPGTFTVTTEQALTQVQDLEYVVRLLEDQNRNLRAVALSAEQRRLQAVRDLGSAHTASAEQEEALHAAERAPAAAHERSDTGRVPQRAPTTGHYAVPSNLRASGAPREPVVRANQDAGLEAWARSLDPDVRLALIEENEKKDAEIKDAYDHAQRLAQEYNMGFNFTGLEYSQAARVEMMAAAGPGITHNSTIAEIRDDMEDTIHTAARALGVSRGGAGSSRRITINFPGENTFSKDTASKGPRRS